VEDAVNTKLEVVSRSRGPQVKETAPVPGVGVMVEWVPVGCDLGRLLAWQAAPRLLAEHIPGKRCSFPVGTPQQLKALGLPAAHAPMVSLSSFSSVQPAGAMTSPAVLAASTTTR
jgi:hypothetical protein